MRISEFARENGVTVRTLHHYDQIGVLRPSQGQAENGYREYAPEDAQRLQTLRFYQTVGFSLQDAAKLVSMSETERASALKTQQEALIRQRDRLNRLIALLEPAAQHPEKPSMTALLSAYARAFHAASDSRGFRDDHARLLFAEEEWGKISAYLLSGRQFLLPEASELPEHEALSRIVRTQFLPVTLARTILGEQVLKREVNAGTRQVVILGAGYDMLALRHPMLTVYEVDRPHMLADKRKRLRRVGLPLAAVNVPADVMLDDLPARLKEAGFQPAAKALFTLLGVSYYLSTAALDALLADVAELSTRGTAILLDYADEGFQGSDVSRVCRMGAMAEAAGEPVRTCLSEGAMAALLERHGFSIFDHVSWQEMQIRCLSESSDVQAFEHINCVLAVFTG